MKLLKFWTLLLHRAHLIFSMKMAGFHSVTTIGSPKELANCNKGRAFGILKRMREGLAALNEPSQKDAESGEVAIAPISENRNVFIVHGHDDASLEKVVNLVGKFGLDPIVLGKKANSGMTIIEKIEKYGDIGFAVVLMTPDDKGNDKSNVSNGVFQDRPRQNVLIEFGYFWGSWEDEECVF